MKRGDVIIPLTELEQLLARTSRAKAEMTELLRQLEASATGADIKMPGAWRHDPTGYAKTHHLD